jgi:hypothetical protein
MLYDLFLPLRFLFYCGSGEFFYIAGVRLRRLFSAVNVVQLREQLLSLPVPVCLHGHQCCGNKHSLSQIPHRKGQSYFENVSHQPTR